MGSEPPNPFCMQSTKQGDHQNSYLIQPQKAVLIQDGASSREGCQQERVSWSRSWGKKNLLLREVGSLGIPKINCISFLQPHHHDWTPQSLFTQALCQLKNFIAKELGEKEDSRRLCWLFTYLLSSYGTRCLFLCSGNRKHSMKKI